MSNKLINGNGKEAVFTEHALDYVKKLGYDVVRQRAVVYTIIIMGLLMLNVAMASAQFNFDDETLPTLNLEQNLTLININFNSSLNETYLDTKYWRLDAGNDPPSTSWNMGSNSFIDVASILFDGTGTPTITGTNPNSLILTVRDLFMDSNNVRTGTGALSSVLNTFRTTGEDGDLRYDGTTDEFRMNRNLSVTGLLDIGGIDKVDNITVYNQTFFEFKQDTTGSYGGLRWDTVVGDYIMRVEGLQHVWRGATLVADAGFLTIGGGSHTDVGIKFDTNTVDDEFNFDGSKYSLSHDIGFNDASGKRQGLLFGTFNQGARNSNLSSYPIGCAFFNNCDIRIYSVGDFTFSRQHSINTTNDFCIQGENCLSEAKATYGNMWIHNESKTPVDFITVGVWVNVTSWNSGRLKDVTVINNRTFNIEETGLYFINYHLSFGLLSGALSSQEIEFSIDLNNGDILNQTHSQRDTQSSTVGNTGANSILSLNAGDNITIKARDNTSPTTQDIGIHNAQFTIQKL